MDYNKIIEIIKRVIEEDVFDIKENHIGYSRKVFIINNKYVLKIILQNDIDSIKEVSLLEKRMFDFVPNIIYKDFSKSKVPYSFYLETLSPGTLLLEKWPTLSRKDQEKILNRLISILNKIHHVETDSAGFQINLVEEYKQYLNNVVQKNILQKEEIGFLNELIEIIPVLFASSKIGLIHGDLHFNNIIVDDNNVLSLIDFEKSTTTYIEREYDPIYRMMRNPNAFNNRVNSNLNPTDFSCILDYISSRSKENFDDMFYNRLLFFDCLNSLRWLAKYPTYDVYRDVLFNKSRKLLK